MIILVDTREQLPYWQGSECCKACLIAGDYTTMLLLNKFHIERKSPQDLYSTVTKGNWRFKNELIRARDRNIKLVVYVESTKFQFVEKLFPRGNERKFSTEGLRKIISTFETRYQIEFVWCRTRERAKIMVLNRLKKEQRKLKQL